MMQKQEEKALIKERPKMTMQIGERSGTKKLMKMKKTEFNSGIMIPKKKEQDKEVEDTVKQHVKKEMMKLIRKRKVPVPENLQKLAPSTRKEKCQTKQVKMIKEEMILAFKTVEDLDMSNELDKAVEKVELKESLSEYTKETLFEYIEKVEEKKV